MNFNLEMRDLKLMAKAGITYCIFNPRLKPWAKNNPFINGFSH